MKFLKNIGLVIVIAVVAYNSVYFGELDEVKAAKSGSEFNASTYAASFWDKKLLPAADKAIDVSSLIEMLSTDADKAFYEHSHALGIGNLRYFLVKGSAMVENVTSDEVILVLEGGQRVTLATELVFGNAVRDATGLIDINEFTNTMDFNNVSAELNKIIREKVLPAFKQVVRKGDTVEFAGAIELNRNYPELTEIEVIPVTVYILP
jgi:predicted lipoprotein